MAIPYVVPTAICWHRKGRDERMFAGDCSWSLTGYNLDAVVRVSTWSITIACRSMGHVSASSSISRDQITLEAG